MDANANICLYLYTYFYIERNNFFQMEYVFSQNTVDFLENDDLNERTFA